MKDGIITLVCGSSGSGKTIWTRNELKKHKRVLIWDIERANEYNAEPVYTVARLAELARSPKAGRFAFMPSSPAQFDIFCKIAFIWAQKCAIQRAYSCIVVEELSDVTTPGKAPISWGSIVRRARKRGCSVYGITQRPAESDKTILGNASIIHCGWLSRFDDCKYMGKQLNAKPELISDLKPLEYIERNLKTNTSKRGKTHA